MSLIDIALEAYSEEYKHWGINSTHLGTYIHRNHVIQKDYPVYTNRPEVESDKHKLAHRAAFKKALFALSLPPFPDYIHEKVEQQIPWVKLLDSADYIDGQPPEVITKSYLKIISGI